ncbi:hypothetical protein PAPYR_742 [Paratrimastix pyriformis]|uniref:MYND-type domain-containing protein n=1 Tax=Paratrimastix pyriformis TaxID=342808 RepID=A0ABQ8UVX6_9EUKA|nr:hypothetical protein PAPYR_742 [Paratrimastix pyriformis]
MQHCAFCGKPATKRCSRCQAAFYCSAEHQKADWKKHKATCAPPRDEPPPQPTAEEREEFIIDSYRLRADDDCVYGGCNQHGIYLDYSTKHEIVLDFLIYCKMAVRNGIIPPGWNWERFLGRAASLIAYAFEKSDAHDKWAGFAARELRCIAERVYGTVAIPFEESPEALIAVTKAVGELKVTPLDALLESERRTPGAASLFQDVGGLQLWAILHLRLETDRPDGPFT